VIDVEMQFKKRLQRRGMIIFRFGAYLGNIFLSEIVESQSYRTCGHMNLLAPYPKHLDLIEPEQLPLPATNPQQRISDYSMLYINKIYSNFHT
jgi:hypothetical protein